GGTFGDRYFEPALLQRRPLVVQTPSPLLGRFARVDRAAPDRSLVGSMPGLSGWYSQAEEAWPRPWCPGDLARHRREPGATCTAEQRAVLEHRHPMRDAVPFAHQHRAGRESIQRRFR